MLVPLIWLSGIGFAAISLLKQKYFLVIQSLIFIIFIFQFLSYWHSYTRHYRYTGSNLWHYGYEQIFNQLSPFLSQANNVYINSTYEPTPVRFAFYTKLPPRQFQEGLSVTNYDDNLTDLFSGLKIGDKYYFGRIKDIDKLDQLIQPKDIYMAVRNEEVPGDWNWNKSPPAGLTGLGQAENVYGDPYFFLIGNDILTP